MKKTLLVLFLSIVLVFLVINCAYMDNEVLPPSVVPVVILKGSDYEMGYQYGQQMAKYLNVRKDDLWVSCIKTFGSREIVIRELKADQYYIKKYTPEAIEMMKGMADGATAAGYELSYLDTLLLNSAIRKKKSTETYKPTYPLEAKDDELPPEECSSFSAWGSTTTDGQLICSRSNDGSFKEYSVVVVAFPEKGNSYLALCWRVGSLANASAINNKGLFIGGSGGGSGRPRDYDYGMPYYVWFQHVLRFANNATEAKDIFMPWKYTSLRNYHFSDVDGNAYVVETTAALKTVREPGDFGEEGFIYATNNFFNPEMREVSSAKQFVEHGGWVGPGSAGAHSVPRNLMIWNMLNNYRGEVDVDFVKMMWRFRTTEPPYPGSKKAYADTMAKGWDTTIGNLTNRYINIAIPDRGDKGVMYTCDGPARKLSYPSSPGSQHFRIAATNSFYKLTLAANPAKVIEAAKKDAHAYIAELYRELMKQSYTDPGYAVLNELFSQANVEYFEGINAYNKGMLASGNSTLLAFSQAATAFVKSQAHAMQAYNLLVPPPCKPEDLDLKPYKGSWAEWAIRGW